jgi:hypothetical protein
MAASFSAINLGPIAITTAKLGALPLALGAGGGIAAYYGETYLNQHKWVGILLGVLAGMGLGTFLVLR